MRIQLFLCCFWLISISSGQAQQTSSNTSADSLTLEECITYALNHQPEIRQLQLDEQIVDRMIKSRLADWYPQLNLNFSLQHFLQLPVIILPDFTNPNGPRREVQTGVQNTSTGAFSLTQTLFNRDVLLANRTSRDVLRQVTQNTENLKINLTVDVSKAFFDLLLTIQQQDILQAQIGRLERNLKDTFNQFQGGIVDKTDYKRATIALNNARVQLRQVQEQARAGEAVLKNRMGFPVEEPLRLSHSSTRLEAEAYLDTMQMVRYENRIEFQLLQTRQQLLKSQIDYERWSRLPTVSAFLNYNLVYQNQEFRQLYSQSFPNSLFGLTLAYPIFQGGKRLHTMKIAELQLERSNSEVQGLRNAISSEYIQALAYYKAEWVNYQALKENVELAREVYDVIELQYKSGVKTYLEVIIAQTDLRTAELTYANALYQVISRKLDVERALGTIDY
ncbi:TolC family protein [Arundinibacter roseus]|uniref:TolC family protein n=1 Tax=Arundinibacter roseus TaxID=2070510 RepID=A0A4R4KJS5_9BACT|nr:TolC family protein [Arundinibacter roseus]TDB68243.1 TolC family protein [Arundinibacter roseus]